MHTTEQLNAALAGRYQVIRLIGAGGMATVYLARDLRHNRNVALKVLRPDLGVALGEDRFLSEIEVTANLQHPNLLPLFDSGAANGLLFYVMPYIEGESLRARLDREKQLPVDEAVHIATSIAAALDYAHRRGVIHRDLKPENVLLHDGEPLVADFGIALAVSNAGGNRITQTGVSLGTPQYMSPEQATGDRQLDARSDIYSLGSVTYEMLTGEPPHIGSTSQAIIARVITEAPRPLRANRPSVPEHVEGAVLRALEKLAADRWVTAREFSEALVGSRPVPTRAGTAAQRSNRDQTRHVSTRRQRSEFIAWTVAVAGSAAAIWLAFSETNRDSNTFPFTFEAIPPDSALATAGPSGSPPSISRDGRILVFAARLAGSPSMLYVWDLADRTVEVIAGSDNARSPVLSPDGADVIFSPNSAERLYRVPIKGGPQRLVSNHATGNGQAWWIDGQRLVYADSGKLKVVSSDGGEPRLLATPDSSRRHSWYGYPSVLPGGSHALITIWKGSGREQVLDSARVGYVSLSDGAIHELGVPGTSARYAAGYVFYVSSDLTLFARPFSVGRLRTTGPAVQVAQGVQMGGLGGAVFAVADNGTIVYTGGSLGIGSMNELIAVGPTVSRPLGGKAGFYSSPRASPDGRTIAVTAASHDPSLTGTAGAKPNVLRFNMASRTFSSHTKDSASMGPSWSKDGNNIIFVRAPADTVVLSTPSFGGTPSIVAQSPRRIIEVDASSTPYVALRVAAEIGGSADIFIAHKDSLNTAARPLFAESYSETSPRISPDGRLIAYVSDRTDVNEVWVRLLLGAGPGFQVTTGGGARPVWDPATGSRVLYYRPARTAQLWSVRVADDGKSVTSRSIVPLSKNQAGDYDVLPGTNEFVMLRGATAGQRLQRIMILNWAPPNPRRH